MNDEYLWSKKGCDPEIKRFEELLLPFRYMRDNPPELPTAIVSGLAAAPKRRSAWIFAIAAPAAAALIIAVWFAIPKKTELTAISINRIPTVDRSDLKSGSILHQNVPDLLSEKLQRSETRFDTGTITLNRIIRKRKHIAIASQTVTLTREEKFAYDRLMLALSIAGSKLKIVQDTIDRTDETDQKNIRNEK